MNSSLTDTLLHGADYNPGHWLAWTTPSRDSSGSMPLGNGDIGLNVWVEEDGDLLFYLSKTDAWDENARLLKLGRIRVSLSPNPFVVGDGFRQEIDLATGCIRIQMTPCVAEDATPPARCGTQASGEGAASTVVDATPPARCGTLVSGEGAASTVVDATPPSRCDAASTPMTFLIWADANRPVVRLEINTDHPVEAKVTLELWRTVERKREGAEGHCPAGLRSPDERETVYPDTVLPSASDSVLWCHRNRTSCWTATLEMQHMAGWVNEGHDPLLNRTFGALLRGEGFVKDGECALRTAAPCHRIVMSLHPLTSQAPTLDEWVREVTEQAQRSDAVPLEAAFAEHTAWWRAFWQRSWIHVSGTPEAEVVSRGYELQRFINACAGRGALPIKFNGSIFTVDAREKEHYDADYRRWGGGYWFQNTRLTYWPMIMSGDFDLMEPWFRMYLDALPFAMARAKVCFGIDDAAMFPETMTFWGTFLNANYGYTPAANRTEDRTVPQGPSEMGNRAGLPPGLSENTYIRRYWQGMLELIAVVLDVYAVSGDESLLREKLLVLAPPFLRFYRGYYSRRDDEGNILFKPSQALETWHDAVNPAPDIAGLQWVLDGLLALPDAAVSEALRAEWTEFRRILPPLPTRSYFWQKRKEVIPALQYDDCKNCENVALYTVFPYRLFGVGKPELEVGRATWAERPVKQTGGWSQDAIQAALLGLTEEVKADVVKNFSTSHAGSRFPAFWGPNFDWIPDQDHGSVASIALQRMLLQFDGGKLLLLPAWPKEWNVDFRLHAPGRTVVEGRVRDGKFEYLSVEPETRRGDTVVSDTQE